MTRTRRWTRREYDRLIEQGFLHEDEPVELVGGQLMVAEPQGSAHAVGVSLGARAFGRAFGSSWYVMVQLPVALDAESEPEPDLAVVPGDPRDYRDAHPSRPVLVVEVAESTLSFGPGPVVAGGMLFTNSGYAYLGMGAGGNVLLAFGPE